MRHSVLAVAAALGLVLAACTADPQALAPGSNTEVRVYLLTEADGCKIYRFSDSGRYHYFTRCTPGEQVSTLSTSSCGKNCVRSNEITTSNEEGRWVQ